MPTEGPPQDEPDLDQLRRENEALKEQVEGYRHLEEDLAAHRVFENAKKRLISWLSIGGIALAVLSLFGLKQIFDLTAQTATDLTGQQVEEIVTQEFMTERVEAKIDERLAAADAQIEQKLGDLDAQIQQASADMADARADLQVTLEEIDRFRGEVGSIREVLFRGAQPEKQEAYALPGPAAVPDDAETTVPAREPEAAASTETTAPSVRAEEQTSIRFANRSQTAVDVFWVGYGGEEVPYARLAPDDVYDQETYVTHPWVVRTVEDGRKVGSVVAGPKPMTFEITQGLIEKAQASKY